MCDAAFDVVLNFYQDSIVGPVQMGMTLEIHGESFFGFDRLCLPSVFGSAYPVFNRKALLLRQ